VKKHIVIAVALTLALAALCPIPVSAAHINVVQNGTFESGMAHWTPWTQGPGTHSVSTVAEGIPGLAAELLNEDSGNSNNTTALRQLLTNNLEGVNCLYLSAKVRVLGQSHRSSLHLPCEFDFPAMISLQYVDVNGELRKYQHGFYVTHTLGYVQESTEVVAGEWFDFTSPNLMDYLPFTPALLKRVEVSGVGWDYQAQFDNVAVSICQVPEPSAFVCFAAMIGALPLAIRRRK